MKRTLLAAAAAALFTVPALAADAKPKAEATGDKPAGAVTEKTGTEATKEVGKAVPEMTNPDKNAQPPTKAVGEAVPPMTPEATKTTEKDSEKSPAKN